MLSFNSANISSVTPLGLYAGYLLVGSGNIWVGAALLGVTCLSFFLTIGSLCRLIINYRRTRPFIGTSGATPHYIEGNSLSI